MTASVNPHGYLIRNGVVADIVADSAEITGCAFISVNERGDSEMSAPARPVFIDHRFGLT